jgi:hypothetical protein
MESSGIIAQPRPRGRWDQAGYGVADPMGGYVDLSFSFIFSYIFSGNDHLVSCGFGSTQSEFVGDGGRLVPPSIHAVMCRRATR